MPLFLRLSILAVSLLSTVGWAAPALLDSYSYPTGDEASASGIIEDSSGILYAIGRDEFNGLTRWVVRTSRDDGKSWTTSDTYSGSSSLEPYAIAEDHIGTVYVLGLSANYDAVIRKTGNGGKSWTEMPVPGHVYDPKKIAADESGHLYLSGLLLSTGYFGIKTTDDGGNTWTDIPKLNTAALTIATSGRVYALEDDNGKPFLDFSDDYGKNWSRAAMPALASGTRDLIDLTVNPRTKRVHALIYDDLGRQGGTWQLLSSADDGKTWSTSEILTTTKYSNPRAIVVGKNDELYVAGKAPQGNADQWIVRKSVDGGSTWTTVRQSTNVGRTSWEANSAVLTRSGALLIAGYSQDSWSQKWHVEKTTDAGASWQTVDDFQLQSFNGAQARKVLDDRRGNLFAIGTVRTGGRDYSSSFWVTRRSGDSGKTWSNVDFFQNQALPSTPVDFAIDSKGAIYVAGTYDDRSGDGSSSHWIVRKSADAGATWSIVDQFSSPNTSSRLIPTALVIDEKDRVYVFGTMESGVDPVASYGVVRVSADGGKSWNAQVIESATDVFAPRSALSAQGVLYVAGDDTTVLRNRGVKDPQTESRWAVYRSANGGASWSRIDTQAAPNTTAASITMAKDGSLYVLGGTPGSSGGGAIVRKSADSGATWSTVWSYTEQYLDLVKFSLTADDQGHVYAGVCLTNYQTSSCHVFESEDGGKSWPKLGDAAVVTDTDHGAIVLTPVAGGGAYYAGYNADATTQGNSWVVEKF